MKKQSKALAGALGAGAGYVIGEHVAEIVLWALGKMALFEGIPHGAVQGLVVAGVAWAAVYLAPKNQEA